MFNENNEVRISLSDPTQSSRVPFLLFLILVASNSVIAYLPLSLPLKGLALLLGVILPLYLLFRSPLDFPLIPQESEDPVPLYGFYRLGALVLITRLVFLTTYQAWPGGDEGLHGFLALGLIPHWNWSFFYTCGEHPPLLIWVLALLIRWTNSMFFSLWFVPAVFSIAGWFLLASAARRILSPNAASLFSFLAALSFWPLYSARFCHQGALLAPFLGALLYCTARAVKEETIFSRTAWAFAAGAALGLGLLTFTAWLVTIPFMLLFMVWIAA
jgi:hypothetical protein